MTNKVETDEALEDAYRAWLDMNHSALELGGTGDLWDLLRRLMSAALNT